MPETLSKVFGIDLGTTYSCIAYVDEHGKPVVVPNAENERITPSVVFFDGDNVVVGAVAKENAKLYPRAVVEMVKRSMGDPNYLFEHEGKTFRAEEISAYILKKLVGDAEQALGEKITDVAITCPAYFGVNQREATARAGEIAGLKVRSIINEPTAAAISYGMDKAKNQVVLVYDLGGGTFDITMIEVKDAAITVLCTGGDHDLGGKNWDAQIVTYLVSQYQEQTGSSDDILEEPETLQDLYIQAERAKKTLSQREKAPLKVTHAGQHAKVELTREKFDELTAPLLERTVTLTQEMLREAAQKGFTHYDKILLVGGSTRMPQVARRLKEEFKVECEMYDPDESVAKGAAIYGWKLALDDEIKTAVAERTGQKVEQVDIATVSAAVVNEAQQQVAREFNLRLGAVKKANETRVTNVTSKTFGIVAVDERMQERVYNLIKRNDKVPAERCQTFGTVEANQISVDVRLMENLELNDVVELVNCTEIGKGEFNGLPSGLPAGTPIDVSFRLTEQGRLEVLVTEPTSKKKFEMTVETASVMSEEEVEKAKSRALAMKVS